MNIRQELPTDYPAVFKIIEEAFGNEEYSDQQEQFLVNRLRKSSAFIPELSLVAEKDGEVIGHILLTKINIIDGEIAHPSLALAPVTVSPAYQKQGIGGQLVKKAHGQARTLGYKSIVLLGHKDYYPRFGYVRTSKFGISLPFEVPDENAMAIELVEEGLKGVNGRVEYAPEFLAE